MKFTCRKVVKSTGDVELRLCVSLSADEAEGATKTTDDPNVTVDVHRLCQGEDIVVRIDNVLRWTAILAYHADLWNNRDKPEVQELMFRAGMRKKLRESQRNIKSEKRKARRKSR